MAAMVRHLVDAMNANKMLNVCNAWDGVQHNSCSALVEELSAKVNAELQKVKAGGPLPIGPTGGPKHLPVRDEDLAKAMKAMRNRLSEDWKQRAVGNEDVRADYWQELRTKLSYQERELEQLNISLAQQQLTKAGESWKAWLAEEGDVSAGDPRAEELARLIENGVPMQPCAREVSEALSAARMARVRWTGSMHALKAELQLANAGAHSASEASKMLVADDKTLVGSREIGR